MTTKYFPISFTRPETNEPEEYRTIAKAPTYEVSSLGNVRNKKTGKILKQERTWNHYLRVALKVDGKTKHFRVHVLVAEAFVPNPNGYTEVNHRDMDRTNNYYKNLGWTTQENNKRYTQILRALNPELIKEIEKIFSEEVKNYAASEAYNEPRRERKTVGTAKWDNDHSKTYPRKK